MPTYQYACTACDERLEAVQSFSDAPLTSCPACGGGLRKVFSAVGVVFKGSGFYKNDSREAAKKSSSTTSESPGSGSSGGGSSEGGSSSKPGPSGGSPDSGSTTPAKAAPAAASTPAASKTA